MSDLPHGGRKPLRTEALLFVGAAVFFAVIAGIYGLTGIYLLVLGNRIDPRPEDDPFADIEDGAGEVGVFSPWSWWPLVLGIAVALLFLGLVVGAWVSALGAVLGIIGLVGQIYEFSRGQHAH